MAAKTVDRLLRQYDRRVKPIGDVEVDVGMRKVEFTDIAPADGYFDAVIWLTLGWVLMFMIIATFVFFAAIVAFRPNPKSKFCACRTWFGISSS